MSHSTGTDVPCLRPMRVEDLPSALALSTDVGWNQSPADWQRLWLLEPAGCFAAEERGTLVGTTLCCVFGAVAWLAMVIVAPSHRGRGWGRRLVERGLDFVEERGVVTVRLDATPLGEQVYRPLGFESQFELIRMAGLCTRAAGESIGPPAEITTADRSAWPTVLEWDRRATQTDRGKLLERMWSETPPWIARTASGTVQGFLFRRQGRVAVQFGPCCGAPEIAPALLREAMRTAHGTNVIVDVPATRVDLLAIAEEFGLSPQRTLLRMTRGPAVIEDERHFHISYGGEFG